MDSQLNILIVGASIAGPTAAYWFARAGAKVTVIEHCAELRKGGQNVDIRTAGVAVMRRMPGMEAAVRAKRVPIDGIGLVDTEDRPYGIMRPTKNPDQQSLISEYEIFRDDLAGILYDMTKDNERIRYVFGESIQSAQHRNGGPTYVEFANGLAAETFDLVVACDGAMSRTRAIAFDCKVRDHLVPLNSWGAFFNIKSSWLSDESIGMAHNAPGGRFMAMGPNPRGGSCVFLLSSHTENDTEGMDAFRTAMKTGDRELRDHVSKRFEGMGWRCPEALAGMAESEIFYGNEMVQVKLPSLSRGRFVMVGDAGYAVGLTGGGTTMALAGAYYLAGEVCKHPGDLCAALAGYEEKMRPLIGAFQKTPIGISSIMAPQTAVGIWVRNMLFTALARMTGLFGYIQGLWASAFADGRRTLFQLQDYPWKHG